MAVLGRFKADKGNSAFQAQYQQNLTDGEDEFLSMSDLHLVETLPNESVFVRRVGAGIRRRRLVRVVTLQWG
ncbi:hypothetical protein [Ruegeria arenilitoris]|nr:hypothetical protein [Ruegeria arenilitoris]